MKKRSLILSLGLALMMMFAFSSMAFGTEATAGNEKAEKILDTENMVESEFYTNSYTDEEGNLVTEETKVYTGEDGWGIRETTQLILEPNNDIVPYASGNVTKNVNHYVTRFGVDVYRIYIWGQFQYNGSSATVVDASWNTRILDDSVYEERAPYGDSGTSFGKAQIWVNYTLGDDKGTFKGTKTLECGKNGN